MNSTDLQEAVSLTNNVVLSALQGLVQGKSGSTGSQLLQMCGTLVANAGTELNATPDGDYTFWINLAKCFDAAQILPSITFVQMEAVRVAVDATTPVGMSAIAVKNFSIRMSLAEQAKILAATAFASRQEIDGYFDTINASFDEAETVAANNMDNVAYVALVKLHAAVSNDLSTRARPLPRMVSYTFAKRRSSLVISQTLYQDPTRSGELIAENKPIRPLFMPLIGKALAS